MEIILYIATGIIIGTALGWLIAKAKTSSAIQAEKDAAQLKYSELEKEYYNHKANSSADLKAAQDKIQDKVTFIEEIKEELKVSKNELSESNQQLATAKATNDSLNDKLEANSCFFHFLELFGETKICGETFCPQKWIKSGLKWA